MDSIFRSPRDACWSFLLIALLGSSRSTPSAAATDKAGAPSTKTTVANSYRIKGMRAYLYHQEKAAFGDDDILTGTVALRNVFIGEGNDETPSGATLVLVDLEGPDFARSVPQTLYLNINARAGRREMGSARLRVKDFFSSSSRVSVPFILYGGPCEPLHIVASLNGIRDSQPISAIAPFNCGE